MAYCSERVDSGNKDYNTNQIPRVISGVTKNCLILAQSLYEQIVTKTFPVSSPKVAEATKLLENIYRAVNIALINELKVIFDKMGIDIWEVVDAASTKPFGFTPFYPGPGLGGHCIPIDPFYLAWKARSYEIPTHFIELAGQINTNMPHYVVDKICAGLSRIKKSLEGANILILGLSYKKDIDDTRESPSLKIISILKEHGAKVEYNDPYVPYVSGFRHYPNIKMKSITIKYNSLGNYDCVVIFRFVKWVTENEPVIVYGNGLQERDFTYIDDIAKGTLLALKPRGYEVINLGSDRPVNLDTVIGIIQDILKKKALIDYKPGLPGDLTATWADISKAQKLLGWAPRISLEKGLEQGVKWYKNNRDWANEVTL